VFRKLANAGTTIKGVAEDSTTKSYIDKGNNNGVWADEDSQLGGIVKLINTIRNSSASTTPSKNYYQYMRPFRWSDDVNVLPTLIPVIKPEEKASSDGGFPSGHTNAAYLSSLGLAYAVPERFQEIITRASELGNDRIKAGMHSPLDVMGGRIMATAVAAAALNNKDNSHIKAEAYKEAHEKLLTQEGSSIDRFDNYEENKKNYTERLTYGFNKIGNTPKPMVVPKGAEVLLETRLPYLDSSQRREVLYTTGIESGYPLLDDEEGWGRLNLFAAADGYGAFNGNVTINMDASKGGFNASDIWRNDISGTGSLTKNGTGTLKLTGDNTYSGGTYINEGILEADSSTSLGKGNVTNDGGIFKENVFGTVNLNGEYKQSENSTLELSINGNGDLFIINGNASFGGKLKLNFIDNYIPDNNMTIIKFKSNNESSRFSSLETTGLPTDYKAELIYDNNEIRLLINKSQDNGFSNSTSSHHSSHHSSSSNSDNNNTSADKNSSKDNNIVNNNTNTEKQEEIKSGWQKKDGLWYNISENGIKNTGWFKDSNEKWYYLDKSGAMKTGWFKDSNNKWYYLNESGSMHTGWFKDSDGKWYYLNESGSMHTGWFKDSDGKWYY
ncbi:MAG: phosphatase PAP2 family protein, partial [Clostridium sp.]